MTRPSPLLNKRIFAVYWLLILPMAAYLAWNYYTDAHAQLEPVLRTCIEQSTRMVGQNGEFQLNELNKKVDAYPGPENNELRRRSNAAIRLLDSCGRGVQALFQKTLKPDPVTWAETGKILQQTSDSLQLFAHSNSTTLTGLHELLEVPAMNLISGESARIFRYARTAQRELYLKDLLWKIELARQLILNDLSDRAIDYECRFDQYMPIVHLDSCATAGMPFSGEFTIAGYIASSNLQILIDGVEYPQENGSLNYRMVCRQPGTVQKRLVIKLTNPSTGEIRTYFKDIQIRIAEP